MLQRYNYLVFFRTLAGKELDMSKVYKILFCLMLVAVSIICIAIGVRIGTLLH